MDWGFFMRGGNVLFSRSCVGIQRIFENTLFKSPHPSPLLQGEGAISYCYLIFSSNSKGVDRFRIGF